MRPPSARVLNTTVDLYIAVSSQADGGFQQTLPPLPTMKGVPCSVQYQETGTEFSEQNRLTVVNTYWLLFAQPINLTPRDTIIWTDQTGTVHTLYAEGLPPSEAGRAGPYTIRAIERI